MKPGSIEKATIALEAVKRLDMDDLRTLGDAHLRKLSEDLCLRHLQVFVIMRERKLLPPQPVSAAPSASGTVLPFRRRGS